MSEITVEYLEQLESNEIARHQDRLLELATQYQNRLQDEQERHAYRMQEIQLEMARITGSDEEEEAEG